MDTALAQLIFIAGLSQLSILIASAIIAGYFALSVLFVALSVIYGWAALLPRF